MISTPASTRRLTIFRTLRLSLASRLYYGTLAPLIGWNPTRTCNRLTRGTSVSYGGARHANIAAGLCPHGFHDYRACDNCTMGEPNPRHSHPGDPCQWKVTDDEFGRFMTAIYPEV